MSSKRMTVVPTHFSWQRYLVELATDTNKLMRLHVCLLEAANLVQSHAGIDDERKLTLTATFAAAAHRLVEHGDGTAPPAAQAHLDAHPETDES